MPPAPQRHPCTDTSEPKRFASASKFIQPDYPILETAVHGRTRGIEGDKRFFSLNQQMLQAALSNPLGGAAQWTVITTCIAEKLLQTGQVDAD